MCVVCYTLLDASRRSRHGSESKPPSTVSSIATWAPRNELNEKTCQHSAMKHLKQNKRAPQTHPSELAVPSYYRILVKHGLIEKTMSIPDAHEMFLKVDADPEVRKLRRKVARANRMKHVPALYMATAMALQGMTKQELDALKLRIEERQSSLGRN
jgi:hypothetical protein